jgi:hypothetical protein
MLGIPNLMELSGLVEGMNYYHAIHADIREKALPLRPLQDHSLCYPHQAWEERPQLLPLSGLQVSRLQAIDENMIYRFSDRRRPAVCRVVRRSLSSR